MVNVTEVILNMVSMMNTMWPPQPAVFDGSTYDFVIVGSGAGATLANRLLEICDCSVLLIEAGGNPSDESRIPAEFPNLTNSPMDWNFTSEIEPTSVSQEQNRFRLSSGKVLGGSSAINHLLHIRGVPEDFDYIANLLNDPTWRYDNMLQYFKKSENYKDSGIMNSKYRIFHGDKGPVNITRQISDMAAKFLKAFHEIGYPINPDINSDTLTGYGYIPYIIDLVRQDTAGTYILDVRDRPNLHILRNTFVTKLTIEDNVAVGVEADLENGEKIRIFAKKEVLVCGGAIGSPKLLMLSGIGPKELLEKHGIPVVIDLPVGCNLQEHAAVPIVHKLDFSSAPPTSAPPNRLFPMFLGSVIIDIGATTPLYQTINAYFEHDTPYVRMACSTLFNMRNDICDLLVNESVGRNTLFSLISLYNPRSSGFVALQSADPYTDPITKLNFYGNKLDFTNTVRSLEDFLRISDSTLFRKLGAEMILPEFSDCGSSYLECYARSMTVNLFHLTSTCPMGPVLDSRARVRGVEHLRVVDSSSLPKIPTANPLAAVMALAEKIADLIKDDYPYC